MGEDMVDKIEHELHWKQKHTGTENLSIHGSMPGMNWNDPFYFYGGDAAGLKGTMNGNANTWISESLHIHEAQVTGQ